MQHEDRFNVNRGRQLLLALLIASCAMTALFGLHQVIVAEKPPLVPICRFIIALFIAYFVFKGSMIARVLFALGSGLSAASLLAAAASLGLAQGNIETSVEFLLMASINAFAVWAMFGVPHIQAYWATQKPGQDSSTAEQ